MWKVDLKGCLGLWPAAHCDSVQDKSVCVQRDATTLEVTELPIRKWTQDYKEFLETLIKPEDKNAPALLEVSTSPKTCLVLLQPSLCIILDGD